MDSRSRFIILVLSLIFLGAACQRNTVPPSALPSSDDLDLKSPPVSNDIETEVLYHFGQLGSGFFGFSGRIAPDWSVAYIPEIEAVNIFPAGTGDSALDNSQIFIRYFKADKFLTLSTVDILQREETKVGDHPAVRYRILKKPGVADFYQQPAWRNQEHELIDIRYYSKFSPSIFYVITRNPDLDPEIFENFINSLVFYNDADAWSDPLSEAGSRVTKKPFALYVDPENSPVSPERFSGWHTGVDIEIIGAEELNKEIPVAAICGGPLLAKRVASGYGGAAVQECWRGDQLVSVLYGHLDYQSIRAESGDFLWPGQVLGFLGADQSAETDGQRKHLHLGIHKGTAIDWRGYVSKESELSDWLNPCSFICR